MTGLEHVGTSVFKDVIWQLPESDNCKDLLLQILKEMVIKHKNDYYESAYLVNTKTCDFVYTDATDRPDHVSMTDEMRAFAMEAEGSLISIHNHGDSDIPSSQDLRFSYKLSSKYDFVISTLGDLWQYKSYKLYTVESLDEFFQKCSRSINNLNRDFLKSRVGINDYYQQHVEMMGQAYAVLGLQGILLKELYWCHLPRKRDYELFEKWKISQLKETTAGPQRMEV